MPECQDSVNSSSLPLSDSLSPFGKGLGEETGIGELMADLGSALTEKTEDLCMLGGGQPSFIPEVLTLFQKRLQEISQDLHLMQSVLGEYDPAEGGAAFRTGVSELFKTLYGWEIKMENVGVASGGQSACFHLMNALVGEGQHVMVPLLPDYMGYRDQLVSGARFYSVEGQVHRTGNSFKYSLDRDAIQAAPESIRLMAVSRPTNPSGNVLSDEEVRFLSLECQRRGIPLLIDHAYGEPFPNAVYVETEPFWAPHHIHLYSSSKLGLPGVRTAIVIASTEVITLLGNMTAVTSLANPNLGQALLLPFLHKKGLPHIANTILKPYYQSKMEATLALIHREFANDFSYAVHAPEGAFFLWLWFPELSGTSRDLVRSLKENGVLSISGHWFFFGKEEYSRHSEQCLRLTYSMPEEEVERGIIKVAETLRSLS